MPSHTSSQKPLRITLSALMSKMIVEKLPQIGNFEKTDNMDFTQANEKLTKLIKENIKHKHFDHVTKLAKDYKILITGKGMKDKLQRFNPRESELMFDQRLRLTIAITPAIIHSLMKAFYKVPKTNPLSAKVEMSKEAEGDTSKAVEEVTDRMRKYYGTDSTADGLDYFLQNRFMELTFMDPNSFIVTEWDAFDEKKEKPKPRPFEVSSEEALNFSFVNNTLEWLHVGIKIKMVKPETANGPDPKYEEGMKHTLYLENSALVYEQTLYSKTNLPPDFNGEIIEINSKFYLVRELDTKTEKVPAFRVGYLRDIETNGETMVAPFHPAMCHLETCIKQVSEYNLSHNLHTFPQKIVRLTKVCPGSDGQACKGGKTIEGRICPTCKGTGKAVHTSAQDIIEVELPENIKEEGLLPLSELVYYVPLPVELLKFQKECVDEFTPLCHQAVFNTTALIKKGNNSTTSTAGDPAKTAFEVDNDMDSVDDTLSPFADKYSAVWMSIVEMIAILLDNQKKVRWIHRLPSKFRLKTRDRLYQEYKIASESAMPSFVIDSITDELAETLYQDDAEELLQYRVKKRFFPFKGKTKDEILLLTTSSEVLKETKVLYNYFDQIFEELEMESKSTTKNSFFTLKYADQKAKIDAKVTELMSKLTSETPQAIPFNNPIA